MTANVGGADGQMRVTNDGTGSGMPLRLMRNRSFIYGLVPSAGEYPILMVKRSLAWSITE